jgi:hypothetical protein
MNDTNSLLHSSFFWILWMIGLTLAFYIATEIYVTNELLNTCNSFWSLPCLNNFLPAMKLPIGILTATVTLVGIWSLIFRSQQTAKQIELTLQSNTYDQYRAHKNDFKEVLDDLEKSFKVSFINPFRLYQLIYPNNNSQHVIFQHSDTYLLNICDELEQLAMELNRQENWSSEAFEPRKVHLINIATASQFLSLRLHLHVPDTFALNELIRLDVELDGLSDSYPMNPYFTLKVCDAALHAFYSFSHKERPALPDFIDKCLLNQKLLPEYQSCFATLEEDPEMSYFNIQD